MDETKSSGTEDRFLRDVLRAAGERPGGWNHLAEEAIGRLAETGIRSREELIRRLPTLEANMLPVVLRAVSLMKLRRAGMTLVRLMASADPAVRAAAQAAFSDVEPRRAYRAAARLARTHPDRDIALSAAHALSFTLDEAAAPLLLALFEEEGLPPCVRAQAAEGLGNTLCWTDRRRSLFKRAANSLIAALSSDLRELRFWCCFALGKMRARQAVTGLQRLAESDEDFCPGWWRVRDEASDAILRIAGEGTPCRNTLGWTESGPRVPDAYDAEGRRLEPPSPSHT